MDEEFRPAFGRGLTIAAVVLGVTVVIFVLATSGADDAIVTAPWVMLFVALCWACFWRPKVVVSPGGVRLVNVSRTIDLPWPAITGIETKYALTLITAYGRYAAWAAPAPSTGTALRTAVRSRPAADTGDGDGRAVTKGEMPGTASGDAAALVRQRWESLRDDGFLDDPRLEFDRPPVRWHWDVAGVAGGLVVLSLASLFVP